MGKEVFAQGHRLEPYYLAASAAYLLEYRFRNSRIPSQYKPARYHILLAVRLIANRGPLPPLNSREMERYSVEISEALWNPTQGDELFGAAVTAIEAVSGGRVDRDAIRTLPFTEAVMEHCGVEPPRRRVGSQVNTSSGPAAIP